MKTLPSGHKCRLAAMGRLTPGCQRRTWGLVACLGLILLASAGTCGPAAPSTSIPEAWSTRTPAAGHAVSPLPTATNRPVPTGAPAPSPISPAPIPVYSYRVVRAYPHDPSAYTEGLVLIDGALYEGTGLVGRSGLRRVDLETGVVLQSSALSAPYFGEGIAVLGDEIFQLTWKSQVGFVYDRETLQKERTFAYTTEGWGLTTDGRRLVMSDGTSALHFLDPGTLRVVSSIQVSDGQGPVTHLNELEYIDGEVWANVWLTDRIVRIDPSTGRTTGVVDLTGLLDTTAVPLEVDVLNGIAYDAEGDRLFVTGKLWPWLFEIEIVPPGEE